MSTCPTCTGRDGAHYLGCMPNRLMEAVLAPVLHRLFGGDYEWMPHHTGADDFLLSLEQMRRGEGTVLVEKPQVVEPPAGAAKPAPLDPAAVQRATETVTTITQVAADEFTRIRNEKPEPVDIEPKPEGATAAGRSARRRRESDADAAKRKTNEERDAALDLFIAEHVTPVDGKVFVESPQLTAAYEQWRTLHMPDAPALSTPMQVGFAMTRAGYTNRKQAQRTTHPNAPRPMLYWGIALKPVDGRETEAPTEPAPATRPNEEQVAEIRQLMNEAKAAAGPRVIRPTYDGDLPGRELKSTEYRKLVTKIIDANPGWVYRRNNGNRSGKPRLISPGGRAFTLPNTPSDHRGLLNTRTELRRLGAVV